MDSLRNEKQNLDECGVRAPLEGFERDERGTRARLRRLQQKRSLRKGKRGMALVELAIVIVLIMTVSFGVMEYGWMFFQMHQVNNASRAGAREGVLPDSNNGAVGQVVEEALGQSPDELTILPGDVSSLDAGDLIRVTVTVNYVPLVGLPFLPTPNELRATVAMAKEGPM